MTEMPIKQAYYPVLLGAKVRAGHNLAQLHDVGISLFSRQYPERTIVHTEISEPVYTIDLDPPQFTCAVLISYIETPENQREAIEAALTRGPNRGSNRLPEPSHLTHLLR